MTAFPGAEVPWGPDHSQHSPCPFVPPPRKSLREKTSHFAPHRSARSGCPPGRVAGRWKRRERSQTPALLPLCPLAEGQQLLFCRAVSCGPQLLSWTHSSRSKQSHPCCQVHNELWGSSCGFPEGLIPDANMALCPKMATLCVPVPSVRSVQGRSQGPGIHPQIRHF